jgi:hypothetical protein
MSDVRRGRPEAAAPFVKPRSKVVDRTRAMRNEGVMRGAIAAVVACVLALLQRPVLAGVAGLIGTVTTMLAITSPPGAYAALSRVVERAGEIVGRVLAWVLLLPMFVLVLAPFRFVVRRGTCDALARGFDRSRTTYWSQHGPPRDLEKPY